MGELRSRRRMTRPDGPKCDIASINTGSPVRVTRNLGRSSPVEVGSGAGREVAARNESIQVLQDVQLR